jgi:predicted transcriptional regulator
MGRVKKEVALQHECRAWELRGLGWSQARIAAELGVERSAVSRMLKRAGERVLEELADEVEQVKAEQTAVLEHIADEALQEWQRSKAARKAVTKRTGSAGAGDGKASEQVTQQVAEQTGDVAYLDRAMAALDRIRGIWGADAPQKVAHTTPDGKKPHAPLTDKERDAGILSILARFEVLAPPGGGRGPAAGLEARDPA